MIAPRAAARARFEAARDLAHRGPVLDVEIRATCRDGTACPPVRGPGMVDTGADSSAVRLDAVANARPSGHLLAQGATSGEVRLPVVPLRVSFPGTGLPDREVEAAATPGLAGQGLHMLLGRDLLRDGALHYDGRTGRWALSLGGGEVRSSARPVSGAGAVAALGAILVGVVVVAVVAAG